MEGKTPSQNGIALMGGGVAGTQGQIWGSKAVWMSQGGHAALRGGVQRKVLEEGCVLLEVLGGYAPPPAPTAAAKTCKGSQSWST